MRPYTPSKANTTIAATVAMSSSLLGRDDQKGRLSREISFAAGRAEQFLCPCYNSFCH
jgi:hypothetical protein